MVAKELKLTASISGFITKNDTEIWVDAEKSYKFPYCINEKQAQRIVNSEDRLKTYKAVLIEDIDTLVGRSYMESNAYYIQELSHFLDRHKEWIIRWYVGDM